jgi:hypothetical protein
MESQCLGRPARGSVTKLTAEVDVKNVIWNLHSCRKRSLVAFAKLQKVTIGFVISVRPSVRMEQLDFHWTDFHEI